MACIDDEIPFEISETWVWVRLKEITNLNRGRSQYRPRNDQSLFIDGNIPLVQTGDVANSNIYITNCKSYYNEKGLAQSKLWKKGTLCMTIAANIGDVAILDFDACFPDSVVGCEAYKPIDNNMFLLYGLMSYKDIIDKKSYSTAQKNINVEILQNLIFPLPPLEEQRRIVAKIQEILPIVDKYESCQNRQDTLNKNIKPLLRKSILQEAIQGKLVPQDSKDKPVSILLQRIRDEKQELVKEGKLKKKDIVDSVIYRDDDNRYYEKVGQETIEITEEIPFEIPINWEWCRLRDMCSIFTGATFRKDEVNSDGQGIRILRGGNILPFEIVQKPDDIFLAPDLVKESILLRQNDIITPAVTSLENIGKMARVEQDMPNVTVGGFVFVIRPHYSNEWQSKFLLYFMSSPSAIEFMKSITNKSGQAFYNIGKERLSTTLIPIPPIEEEQHIVAKIEELFDRIKG